jgi:hypothetical protein
MHSSGWGCAKASVIFVCATLALANLGYGAEAPSESASFFCSGAPIGDAASDALNAWGNNPARLAMLQKVRQVAETNGITSLLGLEIGLTGTQRIYNSTWLVESPSGVTSLTVETPDTQRVSPVFSERTVEKTAYALLWTELEDLRVWDTPSDTRNISRQSDTPVFTATFCRQERLHRIRIENPPLPTWGKDDSFDQARRRHDKKAREFMLRPRDRAIEALRLIQAF